jgi:transcriptional regulator with XRE-family HTH domain
LKSAQKMWQPSTGGCSKNGVVAALHNVQNGEGQQRGLPAVADLRWVPTPHFPGVGAFPHCTRKLGCLPETLSPTPAAVDARSPCARCGFRDSCQQDETAIAKDRPHPTDLHVGKRVRMRRMMLGLSHRTLVDALKVTFQQVQKYEKGTNRISASSLLRTSDTLPVPVEFFSEGAPHLRRPPRAGGPAIPRYVSDYLATSDGLRLTKRSCKLPTQRLDDPSSNSSRRLPTPRISKSVC